MDEEYKYLEPAETKKVKNLVRVIVIDRSKSNKNSRNPKDQRKFRKNIVFFASNDELLNCRDMDKGIIIVIIIIVVIIIIIIIIVIVVIIIIIIIVIIVTSLLQKLASVQVIQIR